MKLRPALLVLLCLWSLPLLARAEGTQLSAERLDLLDQRGYFTPAFKSAVHDFLKAQQDLADAEANEKKCRAALPDLRAKCREQVAATAKLRQELAFYAHPEDTDFDALQAAMKNPIVSPEERLALAQAFVWSYPTDPHQAEAQGDLQQIQKQLADQSRSESETSAERSAAHEALVKRAEAGNLTLKEWQGFLPDMSQEELLRHLGRPQQQSTDSWIYTGDWTWDPLTNKRVGLQVNFNGTRVLSVVPFSP